MRLTRILLLVVGAAAIAGVFAASAKAIAFNDTPCSPDVNPTIHLCPSGETGKAFSLVITAHGGCDVYQWSNPGGNLPPGLTMSPPAGSTETISGTPTTQGKFVFWLQIADQPGGPGVPGWCSDSNASQRQFEIDINQGLSISQRQSTLTPAQLNTAYNLQLTAAGAGSSPLTWSIVTGSGSLPAGLTLNSSTGAITGTATTKGDYHFQIQVTDGTRADKQTYTMSVVDPLKITSPAVAAAEIGRPFQATLTAEGGKQPYTWAAAAGTTLPAGLTLDASTGAISGTPTAVADSPVKVTVTDSLGLAQTQDLQLAVSQQLTLVKRTLPTAKVGHYYGARLATVGGVLPKTWKIVAGSLPVGLHLSAKSGYISGTPKRAVTAHVTVQVTDKLGAVSKATFTVKVHA